MSNLVHKPLVPYQTCLIIAMISSQLIWCLKELYHLGKWIR